MHKARKRFGQHFLHDKNIIAKILDAIDPQRDDNLLEIGPGQGALTYPLLQRCGQLTAVELDRDLVSSLREKSQDHGDLEVINADILKFNLDDLPSNKRVRVVGNLPYNISTPLMFHLMKSIENIQDMHFMLQKEVALRIVATENSRDYGRLSVMLQYFCRCQYLFDVAPGCFTPPPRVDSAIIRLHPHLEPVAEVGDFTLFSNIVQTAFGQRRKTIVNALKTRVAPELFDACHIDKNLRAENLSLSDFARLSRATYQRQYDA
ncbi:MAG: 16S rRNA (adenine(1518)-N(6)/adenine(1519)-N(6))-dimethyltransferase RsmA [Gammaproteobacteria bacterium]